MSPVFRHFVIIVFMSGICFSSVGSYAQLAGTNLAEFQYGNLPGVEPKNLSSLYDQLNLSYRQKNLFFKSKIENFYPSAGEDRSYTRLSQYSVQYTDKGFKIQLGSMYQTIGRGILMRNYEQPSSIWESRGYRVRYGFYKDLQGIAASYSRNNFQIKLLRGKVLAVDLPPILDDSERRPDLVEGGEINYTIKDQTLGIAYLRHTNGGMHGNYLTAYLDGGIKNFSYYAEYALGGEDARAVYTGLNYFVGSLGFSLEYKNYQNFLIGAGINDPPSLVKEHSSRLLNRSTHVPVLTNESGYQAEISYHFENNSHLSFNHSMANNLITDNLEYTFREFYLDYEFFVGEKWYTKIFADFSLDPFKAENQRYTSGIILERQSGDYTAGIDFELQRINRDFGEIQKFNNIYSALNLSKGSKFSVSLIMEISDDPFLLEDDSKWLSYPGILMAYQPVRSTSLSLFAGKRRGGPACNSGVCYDVLDFQGVELRVSSTF